MSQNASHSQAFIEEMKQRLLEEQQELSAELAVVARSKGSDYQAKFPDYGRHDEENATEMADYEAMAATTEAMEARLKSVNEALRRIEDGTYGHTENGELIPEERLRANPAAATLATPPRRT